MRLRPALLVPGLLVLALLAAACGDDGEGAEGSPTTTTTTTEAPTTTEPATTTTTTTTTEPPPSTTLPPGVVLFTERGPWDVGIATLDLGDRRADVYYPAIPEPDAETERFDSLSVFPEEFQLLIPAELTGVFDTNAYRDAIPANDEQAYPVLAYSHGFGGFRQVASFHTSHVASWGFVVVTTDHLERGIAAQVRSQLGIEEEDQDVPENQDVLDVLAAFEALGAHPELGPIADLDRVAVTGHSAGGWTAAEAAAEPIVDVYLSIASGAPEVVTQKPAVVFLGQADETVVPERSYELFDELQDAVLVNIAAAGHNSFNDACEEIYALGGLDAIEALIGPEQLARAEDGCVPSFIEPRRSFDTLNHYTVQFLIARLIDPAAAGDLIDTSDAITPLADFRVTGDPFG